MNKLFSMNVFFISLLISLLGSNEILKNNISENKIEKKSAPDHASGKWKHSPLWLPDTHQ